MFMNFNDILKTFMWKIKIILKIFMWEIKIICNDFYILYSKYFLHWTFAKILSYIFSILLWVILFLPFLILTIVAGFLDPINWSNIFFWFVQNQTAWIELFNAISSYPFYIIAESFILLTWFSFLIFWFSYYFISLTDNYLKYFDENETKKYFSTIYFDFWVIWKFLKLSFLVWWVVLLPFLWFIIIFLIILWLIVLFWWVDSILNNMNVYWQNNYFSVLSMIFFLITILIFVYICYRVTFSYIILIDKNNYDKISPLNALKESLKITKWLVVFKFMVIFIVFSVLMTIVSLFWEYFITNAQWYYKSIYTIIVFLIFNWTTEFLIFSIYKNICRKNILINTKIDKNEELKVEEKNKIDDIEK